MRTIFTCYKNSSKTKKHFVAFKMTEKQEKSIVSALNVFTGLTADARILINRARIECQSHKLTVEDPVTLEYITRYIAQLKQVFSPLVLSV